MINDFELLAFQPRTKRGAKTSLTLQTSVASHECSTLYSSPRISRINENSTRTIFVRCLIKSERFESTLIQNEKKSFKITQ